MIYSSVSAAVVSALEAGTKGGTTAQAWQRLYSSIEEEIGDLSSLIRSGGAGLDRTQVDYWLAARLHHLLIPRHWSVLVAKYSTTKAPKIEAMAAVRPLIASPAPALFVFKAVTAWAIPKLKGARQKSSTSISVDVSLDVPDWRRKAELIAAVAAAQAARKRSEGREAELIVLPDSFYNMNTWDPDANPESTRRRWRSGVNEVLDGMVADALACAELLLREEGLLLDHAA